MGTFKVRKTKEQFIAEAISVHGDKYDYSKVEYKTNRTKVCIICPTHGEFWQTPSGHLRGYECRKCGVEKTKKNIYGVGVNDYNGSICYENGKIKTFYTIWSNMLMRCYDESIKEKFPTYKDCYSCSEWHSLSNFKLFFDKYYINDYELDKDLLFKGNKLYSPETCVFLPHEINSFLANKYTNKNAYTTGVTWRESMKKYQARITIEGVEHNLGYYDDIEEARVAYQKAREQQARSLAAKYKENLDIRAYNALLEYKET